MADPYARFARFDDLDKPRRRPRWRKVAFMVVIGLMLLSWVLPLLTGNV